jgi:hypothetical protein
MTMVFGMSRLHGKTAQLMGRAESLSASVAERTIGAAEIVNKKSISLSARLAFFDPLWRVFDRKEDTDDTDNP